jgi:hypothetical protein
VVFLNRFENSIHFSSIHISDSDCLVTANENDVYVKKENEVILDIKVKFAHEG